MYLILFIMCGIFAPFSPCGSCLLALFIICALAWRALKPIILCLLIAGGILFFCFKFLPFLHNKLKLKFRWYNNLSIKLASIKLAPFAPFIPFFILVFLTLVFLGYLLFWEGW